MALRLYALRIAAWALTSDQELREYELRIEQMSVNIEKMRADMRTENRRFMLQIVRALIAAFAAGVGALALNYFGHH